MPTPRAARKPPLPIASWLTTALELRYDRWLTPGADHFGLAFRISIAISGR